MLENSSRTSFSQGWASWGSQEKSFENFDILEIINTEAEYFIILQ